EGLLREPRLPLGLVHLAPAAPVVEARARAEDRLDLGAKLAHARRRVLDVLADRAVLDLDLPGEADLDGRAVAADLVLLALLRLLEALAEDLLDPLRLRLDLEEGLDVVEAGHERLLVLAGRP